MIRLLAGGRHLAVRVVTIRSITIAAAVCAALATLMLGRITLSLVHRQLEMRLDAQIQLEARSLLDAAHDRGIAALVDAVRGRGRDGGNLVGSHSAGSMPEMDYLVVDDHDRRRAGNIEAPIPHAGYHAGYDALIHFRRDDGTDGVAQGVSIPLDGGGRLVVAADRAVIHRIDTTIGMIFAIAFCLFLGIGAVAVFSLDRILTGRLRAFEQLALDVAEGHIERRLPLDGSGVEFDRLAGITNAMLDRIAIMVTNMRDSSAALAHDLRTPLARIRSRVEQLEQTEQTLSRKATLVDTLDDIDGLLDLFGGLLALSELDGKSVRARFIDVDLAAALSDIAEAHRPAIEDSGRHLSLRIGPAHVSGDRALLQRLVGNLIDNAMVHTPGGTSIAIDVGRQGPDALIRVTDDGPGIPQNEHVRVFGRLVRLDAGRASPGHGLGLGIVSAIVAAHGGHVGIVPSASGLIVEVRLPLCEPS